MNKILELSVGIFTIAFLIALAIVFHTFSSRVRAVLVCSIDGTEVYRSQQSLWRRDAYSGDWVASGPGAAIYYRPHPGSHCLTVSAESAQ